MKIALASPRFPKSIDDGLDIARQLVQQAARQEAAVVCFPETFLPGYPLAEFNAPAVSKEALVKALADVCSIARANRIAIVMPMDWYEGDALLNIAHVVSADGTVLGYQSKNQLDPSEDNKWIPGTQRKLFEIEGLKFGVTICHEGFRYPESVRWAARAGAQLVFHPHFTGSDESGKQLTEWAHPASPYYEKAVMMRALENSIYFASVGYATRFQESATAIVAPDGSCVAYQPYGEEGVLVAAIDPNQATRQLAQRFKPELYSYGHTAVDGEK